MLEPSIVILYVNNLTKSREFYQDLLGIKSEKLSPSFNQFTLAQPPTSMTFGYNFLAIDPDSNRLRFCSLRKS
jgi:catechol 2,3-dioxygenase-like lactoylglutathione lyase family enzyme